MYIEGIKNKYLFHILPFKSYDSTCQRTYIVYRQLI
jgi:hypothetical protein